MVEERPTEPQKRSPRGGRPSRLTPTVQAVIVDHVKNGGYISTAAKLAKVGESTVRRWLADGMKDDAEPKYRRFREAVEEAEATFERDFLEKVKKNLDSSEPDLRLSLEVLSRRHSSRWAPPKVRSEISGPDGGSINVDVTVSARKTLLDRLDGMAARLRGEDPDTDTEGDPP